MGTTSVLVAGATGFLGNEICRLLRAKNLSVKAMVRKSTDHLKTGEHTKPGVQVVQGDLTRKESLSQVLQGVKTVITSVESISNPAAKNVAHELGGPQNISQLEAVKIFEDVLQMKIEVQHIPMETLQSQLDNSADPMQKSFSGLMLCVANSDYIDMKEVMSNFPFKLTSVKDFAHAMAENQVSTSK